MKLKPGQTVITKSGKTGTVVQIGTPRQAISARHAVRVALDAFTPHWAGNVVGRRLAGVEVVYRETDIRPQEQQ